MARRKLRHKKLMLKLQYAEAELAEHNHVFDACKVDFINAHNERLNKFPKSTRGKIDNFLVEKDRQVLETIREQREKDLNEAPKGGIKKLYKEIAKKTHPDKLFIGTDTHDRRMHVLRRHRRRTATRAGQA